MVEKTRRILTGATPPLRELAHTVQDGVRVLSESNVTYLDGGEAQTLEIILSSSDLGSLSDELSTAAVTWAETYHLSKSRANVLRALEVDPAGVALEIGSGCGPLTRYLGETCSLVDAIEPVPARARVARARTADLDNVEVFVGTVEDVPRVAAYDLITVIGVLEYVGNGSADESPYLEFLGRLKDLLNPGGTLVIAIENQLGVKYLAGAPEDHTDRVFDGVEGYQTGGIARTFSRARLEGLLARAGFASFFLHSFPDYKIPRVVFADALVEDPDVRDLAWRIPSFPSPDWVTRRPRLLDEFSGWQTIVEAGLGSQFSNSFIVLATHDSTSPLWPADRLASFYNTERRSHFTTESTLGRDGVVRRRRLRDKDPTFEEADLVMRVQDSPLVRQSIDLIDLIARSPEDQLRPLLGRWTRMVDESVRRDDQIASVDLVPHNLLLRSDDLIAIDQEWFARGVDRRSIIARGVLTAADRVAGRVPPDRWAVRTIKDVALLFGQAVGLGPDEAWLQQAVEGEAELQAQVLACPPASDGWAEAVKFRRELLANRLDTLLIEGPLWGRHYKGDETLRELNLVTEELASLRAAYREIEGRWHRLEQRFLIRLYRRAQRLIGRG